MAVLDYHTHLLNTRLMMYVKFILGQLKVFGMVIIGFFIFPFILYPRRILLWKMKDKPNKKWYWWYADTSETGFGSEWNNYLNSTYGLYELVKNQDGLPDYIRFAKFSKLRKWLISYHWMVFRNGAWNYIASNVPPQGQWDNVVCKVNYGDADCLTWRDKSNYGEQSLTWDVDGEKQFRHSLTKKAKWYNIQRLATFIFTLKWHRYYNFMWGMDDERYLMKTRTFNK